MRTHTPQQAQQARASGLQYHARLEVRNPDDTAWVDVSDFLLSADWGRDSDQAVMDAVLELLREVDPATSLAPYMGSSTLNRTSLGAYAPLLKPKRRVRLHTAITAPGVAPTSWLPAFEGIIDDVDSAQGDNVQVVARDLGALLLDRQIEGPQQYALPTGTPLESVLQSMLNANGFSSVLLYTPVSPNWMVRRFEIKDGSLLDNMRALANQIGWDVRYEYDNNDQFRLTLLQPNRETSAPSLQTFNAGDYEAISRFNESGATVRTVVRVHYMHEDGHADDVTVEASPEVIAEYGRLLMVVPVEATFDIHTVADATALANMILADVSRPLADKELQLWYWPFVQVGDTYTFQANGVHYDTDQKMYTFGFRHELRDGHISTRLTVAGEPIGFLRTWHRRADQPEAVPGPRPEIAVRILSSTRTQQQVELTATHPQGLPLQLEVAEGGNGPFTLVGGPGPGPHVHVHVLPRSVEGEQRVLIGRATAVDSGLVAEVAYTADWDFLPEVVSYDVRPIVDANGDQIGWNVSAVVDDDTMSLVVDKLSGDFEIQGDVLHDTEVNKNTSNDVLQDVGQEGVLRLRPFSGAGGTGLEGKRTTVPLLRTPVSSIAMRDLSTTELEVTISANPATAAIHHRHYVSGQAPPAWTVTDPGPATMRIARHNTSDIILEYYAKVAGVSPEPRRRLAIDPDQSADILIDSIVASGSRVVVSADVSDEDIARYEVYAKEGGWPTVDGSEQGALDPVCLRAAHGRNETNTPLYCTDGDWYFILVGYDFAGIAGVRATHGPVEVDSSLPTTPHGQLLWANVIVDEMSPGVEAHRITWGRDANVTLDYDVQIWERATIKGTPGQFQLLGTVDALDPLFWAPSFTARVTDGGPSFFCTWEYRLDLIHNVDGYIMSVSTQISGYYLP